METLALETNDEVADCINNAFSSTELRKLASNVGVSRKRGDSARRTALRIVEQRPLVAARLVEQDWEVNMDASAFAEARRAGASQFSIEEAIIRAPSATLKTRLTDLHRATIGTYYTASVSQVDRRKYKDGRLEPAWFSVALRADDREHVLLKDYYHALMTARGAPRILSTDSSSDSDYVDKYPAKRAWKLFMARMERLRGP